MAGRRRRCVAGPGQRQYDQYVASYHTNTGHYSVTGGYFASAGVDTPPLHAFASTASANGVFQYGASAFPTGSYNATNYWVDVVFNTTRRPDTTAPTVVSKAPAAGATGVSIATTVTATFSEAIAAATVNTGTFELRNAANALVPAAVTYDIGTKTATLTPYAALAADAVFTARVRGGTTDPRIKIWRATRLPPTSPGASPPRRPTAARAACGDRRFWRRRRR